MHPTQKVRYLLQSPGVGQILRRPGRAIDVLGYQDTVVREDDLRGQARGRGGVQDLEFAITIEREDIGMWCVQPQHEIVGADADMERPVGQSVEARNEFDNPRVPARNTLYRVIDVDPGTHAVTGPDSRIERVHAMSPNGIMIR